ncbi:MAG: SDR family oxidoreductase [Proteobacteria bacterium]|nr:SDR family oxidoreductase [Pseudomonadota bacterium]
MRKREEEEEDRAVVISGASTGIGRACALWLSRMGFRVFAGIRKEEDGDALKLEASGQIIPLSLDVTDGASIASAVDTVAGLTENRLFGLVNNAGIAAGGPLECLDITEVRRLLEVNVVGVFAVTRAFAPLLRRRRGRIVNMGSNSGILSTPASSSYCASKFALEAITDALRIELKPFGVLVSIIEPGAIDTPIWGKGLAVSEKGLDKVDPEVYEPYAPLIDFMREKVKDTKGIPVDKVAKAVAHALDSKKPKYRYFVGKNTGLYAVIARLPTRLRDWLVAKGLPKYGG